VEINTRVRALEFLIQQKAPVGVVETVPTFRSHVHHRSAELLAGGALRAASAIFPGG
jgi:hypothetical protein